MLRLSNTQRRLLEELSPRVMQEMKKLVQNCFRPFSSFPTYPRLLRGEMKLDPYFVPPFLFLKAILSKVYSVVRTQALEASGVSEELHRHMARVLPGPELDKTILWSEKVRTRFESFSLLLYIALDGCSMAPSSTILGHRYQLSSGFPYHCDAQAPSHLM